MLPQLLSRAYSYKYLEVLWLPKRTQLWACFHTEPKRLYRRLRSFPSKLQEYTLPPFSRLSTQYHIDPLLTCFLSLDTSRTSLRLQQSTKFSNRHTAPGRYEYSYNLANSRENWAQKKKSRPGQPDNVFTTVRYSAVRYLAERTSQGSDYLRGFCNRFVSRPYRAALSFPPRGVTGTSCYCFEYNLHLIKIPSHLNRESIYTIRVH